MSIIKKTIKEEKCYCKGLNKKCRVCNGTGIYKESIYYFIDEKTGICFSGETLK